MHYGKTLRGASGRRNVLLLALLQAIAANAQAAEPAPAGDPAAANATDPGTAQADQAQAAQNPPSSAPARTSRARATETTELDVVTVTAQKKAENIQKVPIAITAFSGEELADRKIETGADLVTATPNVAFTKTNFASYNFQIRGIGTQALSAISDPAVAISFNDTPLLRNRLFEQEYFDVSNVQVLRGPQGTLFGRNAVGGVVNMVPNLPSLDGFESWIKAEAGNFESKRFSGMVNVPLTDTLAFRLAGAWTDRSGYDHNTVTDKDVNGRNLYSTRASLAWQPSEAFSASIVWEHFNEDDDRSRTGKQLCHNDPGPATINGVTVSHVDINYMSQGCKDGSLYDNGAYGVPQGASLPYVLGLQGVSGVLGLNLNSGNVAYLLKQEGLNPYAGVSQSRDLHEIATTYDPKFRAKNDVAQFNMQFNFQSDLKLISQTLFTRDSYYSTQDYNRFPSVPIFTDSTSPDVLIFNPNLQNLTPGGVFCDPQLGCSDKLLAVDLLDSYSKQWSQELRLQSDYDGNFNFNLGANFLDYKVDESYYVFSNAFTALASNFYNNYLPNPVRDCPRGTYTPDPFDPNALGCIYIDPNSLDKINGDGHNYFRSRNMGHTLSTAIFGETYWQLQDNLKLTLGARVTQDRKITTPVPSQLLLSPGIFGGGFINWGYPEGDKIYQKWTKPSGRAVLDWTPETSFTDSTLLYASYSRGYVAGGTNSPGIGSNPAALQFVPHNPTFEPEYVNAFEIGTKNVMAGGKFSLNVSAFYYDFKNYQVSQLVDRATYNENFNAKSWGLEIEAAWKPTPEFSLFGNIGLLDTRVSSNQYSIDQMDLTAGNPNWVVIRPWVQQSSSCIAPADLVSTVLRNIYAGALFGTENAANILNGFCPYPAAITGGGFKPGDAYAGLLDGRYYDPLTDAPNRGLGFSKNVGGNQLPNAPHITVSLSPQYTFATSHGDFIVRADFYYQGRSWARVYQDRIDRLNDWGNVNLSLTWQRLEEDLTVQLYVKNALDGHAITGTFLNSSDSGLTSNVFLQDPRIIGLSIRKGFF